VTGLAVFEFGSQFLLRDSALLLSEARGGENNGEEYGVYRGKYANGSHDSSSRSLMLPLNNWHFDQRQCFVSRPRGGTSTNVQQSAKDWPHKWAPFPRPERIALSRWQIAALSELFGLRWSHLRMKSLSAARVNMKALVSLAVDIRRAAKADRPGEIGKPVIWGGRASLMGQQAGVLWSQAGL
jgi:hypothetical protein